LKRNREFQWPAPPLHGSCWTTCNTSHSTSLSNLQHTTSQQQHMVTLMYTSGLKVCFFELDFCCIQVKGEVACLRN
jgi:hypothetical protein